MADFMDTILDAFEEGMPLGDALLEHLDAQPLAVDAAEVERVAARAALRIGPAVPVNAGLSPWLRRAGVGLAVAAALVLAAVPWSGGEHRPVEDVGGVETTPDPPPVLLDPDTTAAALVNADAAMDAWEAGDRVRARDLYDRAMDLAPRHPEWPEWAANRVRVLLELEDAEGALRAALDLSEAIRPGTRWWVSNPDGWDEGVERVEESLRRVAVGLHQQMRGGADTGAWADRAYRAWHERFAGTEHEPVMHYAYGEFLYARGRYLSAYEHYLTVLDAHPDHPQARFCGQSAFFALDKAIEQRGPGPAAGDPDLLLDRYVALTSLYLDRFPQDPRGIALRYKAGFTLYQAGRQDDADGWFEDVVTLAPDSAEAELAVDLMVDGAVSREQWDAVVALVERFSGAAWMSEAQREELRELAARAELAAIVRDGSDPDALEGWERRWGMERP